MRIEGGRFGIQSKKTLKKHDLRTQHYKLANLDSVSASIIDGIKDRHAAKVEAAQPISVSEEQKYQRTEKVQNKKRVLKNNQSKFVK